MKKLLYLLLLTISFFSFNSVSAANNKCQLQDENKWEYKATYYGREAQDKAEQENNGFDYSFCCVLDNGTTACDFYSEKIIGQEGENNNQNQTNNTTSNINYCEGLKSTFIIIGHFIRLAKVLIPIIIIAFGMLDLFKAVVGSKDDELKKSIRSLIFRCLAGVCIFFLPAFIDLIFSWVDGWETGYQGQYENCFKCIWDVNSCTGK